jgi:acyl-CoA dehydrogenase
VLVAGTDAQKKQFLSRMTEAPLMASYCVTEPGAGSDVAAIQTKAERKGDEWILNGNKQWITGASHASWYFILAKNIDATATDGPQLTAFLVDAESPGIQVGPKEAMLGQRASDTRSLHFQDLRIPDSQRLGAAGAGFKIAMAAFDATRPIIAAAAVGLAKRALHEALQYATERKSMGKPIISHQMVAAILADMATRIAASRGLVKAACDAASNRQPVTYAASMAKWMAAKTANFCATSAIQVFGGMGYAQAAPAEKLFRDAKIFEIYEGTNEIQQLVISRLLKAKFEAGDDF